MEELIVPESEMEKVKLLLKGREGVEMEIPCDTEKRKFCQSHRKFCKQKIQDKKERGRKESKSDDNSMLPPNFSNKSAYLYYVGAEDCIKRMKSNGVMVFNRCSK